MKQNAARRVLLGTVLIAAGACQRTDTATSRPETAPDSTVAADSVYAPAPERESLPSNRIYYTLTDHAWYARGEPLRHNGIDYAAAGSLVSAGAAEMEQAGEYDGVDFYTLRDDSAAVLYVPVFQGYWQPFRATETARRGD